MSDMSIIIEGAKNVSAVVGCITGAGALCVAVVKPLRKRFAQFIRRVANAKEHEDNIELVNERLDALTSSLETISDKLDRVCKGTKASMGDSIKHIYFTYYKEKKIPYREKEAMIMLHDAYKALNGNHGVDEMFDEAMTWEVI